MWAPGDTIADETAEWDRMTAHFDYDTVDWRLVSRILDENSRRLSRTRAGRSDTGSSALKQPLLLSGDALRARAAHNELKMHEFVWSTRRAGPPDNVDAVRSLLFEIADLTNDGLLPAGRLRTWPIGAHQASASGGVAVSGPEAKVAPDDIPEAVDAFCAIVHARWPELSVDPVPLASWAEWQLNGGPLHPFYDGCGRIARSFGAARLIRGSTLLPLYDSPSAYFRHGNGGNESFAVYVRARIDDCAAWLASA